MTLLLETAPRTLPDPVVKASPRVPSGRLPWWTWGALAGILAAEILGLTLRFDSDQLLRTGGWTAWLLGRASLALSWTVAATAAALLWRGSALLTELRACGPETWRGAGVWALTAHAVALAIFAVLCGRVFEKPPPGPALGFAWLSAGLATLATLTAAALHPRVWLRLARRLGLVLPMAALVGVLALGLSEFVEGFWVPFSRVTLGAVEAGLRLCGQDVVVHAEELMIGTTRFRVEVAQSCSGYGGMALVVVFVGLFLGRERAAFRFPRALVLLPVAIVLVWLTNVVRIVLLILIGSWWWREAALGGFHSQAGWIGLLAVTVGVMTWAGRSRWLLDADAYAVRVGTRNEGVNLTAAYLGPLMALLAGVLATRAFSHDFDLFYPLRLVPALVVLWGYRHAYDLGPWSFSWRPVALGGAAYGLWMLLESSPGPESLGPWDALPPATALGWVIVRVVGATLVVPCAEELAFRGFLLRRLIARDFERVPPGTFTWLSFLASSLAFGLLHDHWLGGIAAGLLYALALYRRRRLSDAVVAHGVTNALLAAHVLAGGRWSLWL